MFTDGRQYSGQFHSDSRHGRGTETWGSVTKYERQWHCDKRHGLGAQIYADGSNYYGHWVENLRHGAGVQKSANKSVIYIGNWIEDIPEYLKENDKVNIKKFSLRPDRKKTSPSSLSTLLTKRKKRPL